MATKYFMAGGVDSNWSSATNWSTTSSAGPNNTTHPIAGDVGVFNAGSPSCTVDETAAAAQINCTGYTNTLTMAATMTTTGSVTLPGGVGGIFDPGAQLWNITAAATIKSNGKSFYNVTIGGTTYTLTLTDNMTVSNTLTINCTTVTLSLHDITCANLTTTAGTIQARTITMSGGTWSGAGTATVKSDITFAGGANVVSGTVRYSTGTILYSSGTVDTTDSTLTIITTAATINTPTANMHWNNITTTADLTLSSEIHLDGVYTSSGPHTIFTSGLVCAGLTATLGISGTTSITLDGGTLSTGSWAPITNPLVFDGNITLGSGSAGKIIYKGPSITRISGTLTAGIGNCYLSIEVAEFAFIGDMSGYTWGRVITHGDETGCEITLGSDFNCEILQISPEGSTLYETGNPVTFIGAYDITVGQIWANTLAWQGAVFPVLTIPAGQTLTCTGLFWVCVDPTWDFYPFHIKSDTPSSYVYLNYSGTPAELLLMSTQFTDIDATGSIIPLYNWHGRTLLRTLGIFNVDIPPASIGAI